MNRRHTEQPVETRGQLLAEQDRQVTELSRQLVAVRRLLPGGLLVVPPFFVGLLAADAVERGDGAATGWLVALAVSVVLALLQLLRHGLRTRRLRAELAKWRQADRTEAGRSLPAGDLRPGGQDLRTGWDARDDEDLSEVLRDWELRRLVEVRDWRLVPGPVLASVLGVLGLAAWIAVIADPAEPMLVQALGLLPALVSMLAAFTTMIREATARQRLLNQTLRDRDTLLPHPHPNPPRRPI